MSKKKKLYVALPQQTQQGYISRKKTTKKHIYQNLYLLMLYHCIRKINYSVNFYKIYFESRIVWASLS